MKFQDGKGVESPRWVANEIVASDDMGFLSLISYQNLTNLLALLAEQDVATGSTKDLVLGGLLLSWVSGMQCSLKAGGVVSYSGSYLASGAWGFVATAGNVFSVLLGQDTSVVFDVGAGGDRYDTLQVRPVFTPYDSKSRNYKDPITHVITSSLTYTKLEFGIEVAILKGTPGAGVAPAHTAGWVKVAEVLVHTADVVIDQNHVKDVRSSAAWTTEASSTVYSRIHSYGLDFGVGSSQISRDAIPISSPVAVSSYPYTIQAPTVANPTLPASLYKLTVGGSGGVVNLPAANSGLWEFLFLVMDSGVGVAVITPNGGDTIGGGLSSYKIRGKSVFALFKSDGVSEWVLEVAPLADLQTKLRMEALI